MACCCGGGGGDCCVCEGITLTDTLYVTFSGLAGIYSLANGSFVCPSIPFGGTAAWQSDPQPAGPPVSNYTAVAAVTCTSVLSGCQLAVSVAVYNSLGQLVLALVGAGVVGQIGTNPSNVNTCTPFFFSNYGIFNYLTSSYPFVGTNVSPGTFVVTE